MSFSKPLSWCPCCHHLKTVSPKYPPSHTPVAVPSTPEECDHSRSEASPESPPLSPPPLEADDTSDHSSVSDAELLSPWSVGRDATESDVAQETSGQQLLHSAYRGFAAHYRCDEEWTKSLFDFLLQLADHRTQHPTDYDQSFQARLPDMPQEESKLADPAKQEAEQEVLVAVNKGKQPAVESDEDDDIPDTEAAPTTEEADDGVPAAAGSKKKKSKRKKIKEALTGRSDPQADKAKAIDKLTPDQISQFMAMNPALAQDVAARSGASSSSTADPAKVQEMLKNMSLQDIMTGLASTGKNVKDMASYKFWQTQPVQTFDEAASSKAIQEGPIKVQKVEDVPTNPSPLLAGFEWVTVDLTEEAQMKEVYELLNGHYVEDDEAMFRFNYGTSILRWALQPPGWRKEWYVGVRASQSGKLVAFISAIPMDLRVRKNIIHASEVNFLCIHKKLRSKRLAPVLIKEITRRCNLAGVWQAIYTGGIVLPTPVSTCRYFHRALNWQKLYDVGFSPLPPNSKPQYQIRKYALPEHTNTNRLREMQPTDIPAVHDLLKRYMARWDLVPEWDQAEMEHWLLPNKDEEQCVWAFVVEDESKKITDFFSFYSLESTIINSTKHKVIRAAYLYYYATETGLITPVDRSALKARLNQLMNDALILAKRDNFDVFNALSMMENALFLEQQKFGGGDGQLHFYLFNYRANPISGGVNKKNQLDENLLSGIGLPML